MLDMNAVGSGIASQIGFTNLQLPPLNTDLDHQFARAERPISAVG
jgi:hypothetical protein